MNGFVFFIATAVLCPKTKIVNHTDFWNATDRQSLVAATKRCGEIYEKSPCLTQFIKIEENLYQAVCGEPISKK
jgi:hypothetical protein